MEKIEELNIEAVENQWTDEFSISSTSDTEIYFLNRYKLDQIQIFPEQAEIIIKRLELIPVNKSLNLTYFYKLEQIENLISKRNDEIAYYKNHLIPELENELNNLKKTIK